jgi:hypothetical protein
MCLRVCEILAPVLLLFFAFCIPKQCDNNRLSIKIDLSSNRPNKYFTTNVINGVVHAGNLLVDR